MNGVGALWLVSRASGLVSFLLLTAALVLGALAARPGGIGPRWARQTLHRDLALLAVGALAVHVLSVVLDSYVDIGWAAVLVPLASGYQPWAVAAGTLALDAILLVVVTSLLRVRLGRRTWRAVHWLVALAWPMAALHYLAVGTDAGTLWGRLLAVAATLAVLVAVGARMLTPSPRPLPVAGGVR